MMVWCGVGAGAGRQWGTWTAVMSVRVTAVVGLEDGELSTGTDRARCPFPMVLLGVGRRGLGPLGSIGSMSGPVPPRG